MAGKKRAPGTTGEGGRSPRDSDYIVLDDHRPAPPRPESSDPPRRRRRYLSIEELIAKYELAVQHDGGNQWMIECPLSLHGEHGNDGIDSHPSCHVDIQKQVWHCKTCGIGGGQKDFRIACEEGLDALWDEHVDREERSPRDQDARPPTPMGRARGAILRVIDGAANPARPRFRLGSHVELAQALIEDLSVGGEGTTVFTRGAFYAYNDIDGIWTERPRAEVAQKIHRWDGLKLAGNDRERLKLTDHAVRGVINRAADMVTDEAFFDQTGAPTVICENGVLLIHHTGVQQKLPSKEARATFRVPCKFVPGAKAPRFTQALAEWLGEDDEAKAKAAVLQEFVGAALAGIATRYQRALILPGPGSNGKSTFLDIISALFPPSTLASVSIHDLSNPYFRAELSNKRLNLCAELPITDVGATEGFKAIVSGDLIEARRPTERPFAFRPSAAHIFVGNSLPRISDTSHGFWRRIVIIEFKRIFDEATADRRLAARIVHDELAGVLDWALVGAVRLLGRGDYTTVKASAEAVDEWRDDSNSVATWMTERTKPTGSTTVERLYSDYVTWCAAAGVRHVTTRRWFGRRLADSGIVGRRTGRSRYFHLSVAGPDYVVV